MYHNRMKILASQIFPLIRIEFDFYLVLFSDIIIVYI